MIIAGEASGDLHGSGVVRELKRLAPGIETYGVGGDKMRQEGMDIIYDIKELGFMGFAEVLRHIPFIRTMRYTLGQIVKFKRPDVLVLIDYPGFNLSFARAIKKYGLRILYYISPQVWAWHRSRIRKIKELVDEMLLIFPFELDMYRAENVKAEFVGHPLLEVLDAKLDRKNFAKRFGLDEQKRFIALLPGSRKQEVDQIFEQMLSAARMIGDKMEIEIVLVIAPTLDEDYFRTLYDLKDVHLVKGLTYEVMANSDFAFVTSGTATLETACFGTPMFVVYKTSWLTYLIGRMLVRVKNIGLVNIVAGKEIVPEFIQYRATAGKLAKSALKLLADQEKLTEMKKELGKVRGMLGTAGASRRVAEKILQTN